MRVHHADRAFARDVAADEVVALQLIKARSDLIHVGPAACEAARLPLRELGGAAALNPSQDFLCVQNPISGRWIEGHFRVLAEELSQGNSADHGIPIDRMSLGRCVLQQMHGTGQADGMSRQFAAESLIALEHARRPLASNLLVEQFEFRLGLRGKRQSMKGSFAVLTPGPLDFKQSADMVSEPNHQLTWHLCLKEIGNL